MNTEAMIKEATEWLEKLREAAFEDKAIEISWFKGTEDSPFAIVGGWSEGFSEGYESLLCTSKADPCYAMCVKIAVNKLSYEHIAIDFDSMSMPRDKNGEIYDVVVALERKENMEELATWLVGEWERISKEFFY